jgi:glycosyltransferase involved in cell wall biosynthesis
MQRSITWTGAIPNWQMPQVLGSFDIAVAPYPAIDNFYFSPLKILEYMAAGLPIVASSIGQIPELIDHGRTGLLVEPGNISELSATVEQLCDNEILRRKLGGAARTEVESRFTWDRAVDRILKTVHLPSALVKQES